MTISVIIGSTRQGRFSEKPALWILQELRKRDGIEARLLDLRDFPMPFFDQPMPPAMPGRPPYEHDVVKNWSAQIAASDSFIFVTSEYNYGPSAVLKNAIDWVYPEWNREAAAFVSYGSAMGARGVQQLLETAYRASNGTDSVICSHSRCDALGTFPRWGRRQGPRRAGQASQRHDRRPLLVDGSSQGGPRTIMGRQ
jgi:NAD(P)H-dependent FMN reductase